MTLLTIGGLLLLAAALIAGIRYLASSTHSRARSTGEAGELFNRRDPGTGDPGPGH